ncbi:MAG: YcjF family protein [Treponema sp.]|jgi:uncharacterized protein (DUF697 family)|nr:YcjF family protein [Treponema sp.]
MAKRNKMDTSDFEIYDALPNADTVASPTDGGDDVPAVEVQTAVEAIEVQSNIPVPIAVQEAKPGTSLYNLITRARVEEIIKNRALLAAGIGLVPVPVFNLVSAAAIQISMVQSITRLYDIEVKKSWIKNIIASVLGGLGATALSGAALKNLGGTPLVGTSLAVLSAPAVNGLTTYAIGYMFVRYFESPEGLLKANAGALREWFKEGFKDGREKLGGVITGKSRTA